MNVIKALNEGNVVSLLEGFRELWVAGVFPDVWKVSRVSFIRKHCDRDYTRAESYRPINLLPVVGKLYEMFIANKLIAHVEASRISYKQLVFRAKRSTTAAIQSLVLRTAIHGGGYC